MIVHEPVMIEVSRLRHNVDNPKKPMRKKERKGLSALIEKYGFAASLVVADNQDGTFTVLNGNSRLDELIENEVEKVSCVVMNLDDSERREFALGYDRHQKVFDESAVIDQLKMLAERGRDVRQLQTISGVDRVAELIGQKKAESKAGKEQASKSKLSSMVLYGPEEDIVAIRQMLKDYKTKMADSTKFRALMGQALDYLFELDEERFATILAASVARLN